MKTPINTLRNQQYIKQTLNLFAVFWAQPASQQPFVRGRVELASWELPHDIQGCQAADALANEVLSDPSIDSQKGSCPKRGLIGPKNTAKQLGMFLIVLGFGCMFVVFCGFKLFQNG